MDSKRQCVSVSGRQARDAVTAERLRQQQHPQTHIRRSTPLHAHTCEHAEGDEQQVQAEDDRHKHGAAHVVHVPRHAVCEE